MKVRIFSQVVGRVLAVSAMTAVPWCSTTSAQSGTGLVTDPATGIIYRPVTKTIERPVVETKVEKREQTVYRPQTVTESKPVSRTVFTPVVEYKWEQRLHGRWNPFRQPTVAYHHTPRTRWEARNEVVQHTNTRTEWIAEKRSIDVPQRIVRMQREQKIDYQAVGRVPQPGATRSNLPDSVASRLRPLPANTQIASLNRQPLQPRTTQVASTVGRLTSDPPPRTSQQGGLRATELLPSAPGVHGQALPPVNGGTGIANAPRALPFFR